MPAPSLRTYPDAAASKARTRPSGAQKPALVRLIVPSGDSRRFVPPARAISHSPLRMFWQARWTATKDDEQAVSSAMLGPCRPKTNDKRLAARQSDVPAAAYESVCATSVESMIPYSLTEMPTKTPVFVPRSDGRGQAGVFQGFPAQFQQEALLRIDPHRLAVGDAEEMVVEGVDLVEVSAPARAHLAGGGGIRVVEPVDVPRGHPVLRVGGVSRMASTPAQSNCQ